MSKASLVKLGELFSDYRAEWSHDLFRSLFIEPPYFGRLQEPRSCILIGGRGTGKTTALKSLRFDSLEARTPTDTPRLDGNVGVYVRMNKNRVRVFAGSGLGADEWGQAFAHYFNLLVCQELCALSSWLMARKPHQPAIDLSRVTAALGLADAHDLDELSRSIDRALIALEFFANNPKQVQRPLLSMAEAPLRYFVEAIHQLPSAKDRFFYCCIDEYENLLEYQQGMLNTYIKHAAPPLCYKVGIRKNGLKTRATTDRDDLLSVPDDYFEVDISAEDFDEFAMRVLEQRLKVALAQGLEVPARADEFLQSLSIDAEADLLGASRIATHVRDRIAKRSSDKLNSWMGGMPDSKLYFLEYWSQSEHVAVDELADDWRKDPSTWDTRLGNYQYASLFWLAKGRKGVRIRKYYSGVKTLIGLASGNIRYFLELIDMSVANQAEVGGDERPLTISPRAQTDAAVAVGRRRLLQIEGTSEHGTQLQRLVLAIGKVFFEFARDPVGRTPETNAFVLSGTPEAIGQLDAILAEGEAHLVFEATPRTKATSQTELRDDEYRLHPIFCAFFWFSHRKKRRATFDADLLLQLDKNPSGVIRELIGRRTSDTEEETPIQLSMFSSFYEGSDE